METKLRAWARSRPGAVAIAHGERTVTYRELELLADDFACALRARGCGRGTRVALLFPHAPETVAAMFGALRAGATYVPLDPAWPDARIAFAIADTTPAVVAALAADAQRVAALARSAALVWEPRAARRTARETAVQPGDPAYVLYTSGSTGTPKGVVQSRGNVAAHALAYARSLRARSTDRLSWLAPFTFDAAVMDVFGSVAAGATLCCYDPRGARLGGVAEFLAASHVSIWHATPTLYRATLGAAPSRLVLPSLRAVVLGGEPVRPSDVRLARERLPARAVLINGFGPTECSVATQYRIARDAPLGEHVPIGRPVAGIDVLLRDGAGRVVDGAGTGEIVLRSARVALGYRRCDDGAATPFGDDDGVRTYATGDVGMRLENGDLVHLGRRDDQVNVRGHRVEPAEIEARLCEIDGVREAAVVATERGGDTHVTAWFVPVRRGRPAPAAVRAGLRASLPSYMLPAAIRPLRALPLLATGKVDRRQLAQRAAARFNGVRTTRRAAPDGSFEDALVVIWRDALGVKPGRDDDFFALGGDSLLALKVTVAAEAVAGGPVPSLFRHPTIAGFARAARRSRAVADRAAPTNGAAAPLSPQQRRYWARCAAGDANAFQVRFAFEIDGALDVRTLQRAFADVVSAHDALRLGFALDGGTAMQRASEIAFALPVRRVTSGSWDHAVLRAARSLRVPLGGAPPLRARLLRRSATQHALVVAFHHLAIDGWSRRLFEDELFARYAHAHDAAGARAPAYVATCDRARPVSQAALRRVLGRARSAPLLRLPGVRGTPSGHGGTRTLAWSLPRDARDALRACAADSSVSLFAVVAAIYVAALAWWARAHTVTITTDRANRTPANARVIGLFADVAIIRVAVARDRPFADLARRVHATVAAAHDDGWPSFADVVDTVWPGLLERYDEIVPAALFFEDAEPPRARAGGVTVRAREVGSGAASRDLMLVVQADGDELEFQLIYRSARFDAAAIGRFAAALRAVTDAVKQTGSLAETLAYLGGENEL